MVFGKKSKHKREPAEEPVEPESALRNRDGALEVTDNRTGKTYEVPIKNGKIDSAEFMKMKASDDDLGVLIRDMGYMNTACCESKITYIDGDNGILRYRGYPIEQLCEQSSFLEVAYLLLYGELPDKKEHDEWNLRIMRHTFIHENLVTFLKNFRYDAHPMGTLISAVSAMSTFYPDANPSLTSSDIFQDRSVLNKQIFRIIGKMPTIAACAYRNRIGRPFNYPDTSGGLSYCENFLYMLDRLSETNYKPDPRLAKALDVLFIIHADHELNCSTAAMRHLGSTLVDPYTAVAGAASALYGPSHGGANEAVLRMLESIGSVDQIPQFLEDVKNKKRKLMGFGHRIYKNFDPRANILRKYTHEVFEILGRDPLMDVAVELEKRALEDEYFKKRRLYPNVDFYSGLIYKAMGFPTDMFPVLFAIPRTVGWLSHWKEYLENNEIFIARPRQVYNGPSPRPYVPMNKRSDSNVDLHTYVQTHSKRRMAQNSEAIV